MDKKNLLIIILICIIVAGSLVFGYQKYNSEINEINQTAYIRGFQDGQLNFYNQLIISLSQNNEIVLPIVVNNQTVNIKLVPIK